MRFGALRRFTTILKALGLVIDRGDWLEPNQVLGCAYPRRRAALSTLADRGISVLVNLHERPHDPARLASHGLSEVHVPVPDFSAPSIDQLADGVTAIDGSITKGKKVAVHCGGGLGRTGTLLACYLVHRGMSADEAIARVQAVRPGSLETADQIAAVKAYARRQIENGA